MTCFRFHPGHPTAHSVPCVAVYGQPSLHRFAGRSDVRQHQHQVRRRVLVYAGTNCKLDKQGLDIHPLLDAPPLTRSLQFHGLSAHRRLEQRFVRRSRFCFPLGRDRCFHHHLSRDLQHVPRPIRPHVLAPPVYLLRAPVLLRRLRHQLGQAEHVAHLTRPQPLLQADAARGQNAASAAGHVPQQGRCCRSTLLSPPQLRASAGQKPQHPGRL